jgi:membrane protease YdiL (CAAX protease family)
VQNEELKDTDYNAPLINELEKNSIAEVETVPTPDNPPWNGWSAMGVWVASIFFIIIFPNIFVLPYIASQNIDFSDSVRLTELVTTDKTAVILQLLAVIPAHVLTLVLAWLVVTRFRKYSFRQTLGWSWGGFKFWHALVMLIFFYALAAGLTSIFGETKNDFMKILESSRAAVFLVAFFATFTAPLVEEVVYRGILYSAFQRRFGIVLAVVAVTFLFALIHVPQYSTNWIPDFVTVTVILFLSLTLTLIRVKTGNLLPCIALHTVFNGIQSILLILQPYLENLAKTQEQPAWIFHLLK